MSLVETIDRDNEYPAIYGSRVITEHRKDVDVQVDNYLTNLYLTSRNEFEDDRIINNVEENTLMTNNKL